LDGSQIQSGSIGEEKIVMCAGPCIIVINEEEEEEQTRYYFVFYYTYDRLNIFRAPLCPSSGAHNYISDYHIDRLILRFLMVGGLMQAGWINVRVSPDT
jgi:hypothetical protein